MSNATVLFDAPGPRTLRLYRRITVGSVVALVLITALVLVTLYREEQFTGEKWEPFVTPNLMVLLLEGLLSTLYAAVLAIIGAVIFGVLFGVAKLSDSVLVRWPAWLVVEFFRAVPLLLLIIFLWAMVGYPRGDLRPLVAGLILYNGAVLAEVFRAGIRSVPPGQAEAALALGMRKSQVMRIILLPQAVKIMFPAIISQCVVALKDTSLGYVILAPGLTVAGRELFRTFGNFLATAIVLAVLYILLNLLVTWVGSIVQRRVIGSTGQANDNGSKSASGDEGLSDGI